MRSSNQRSFDHVGGTDTRVLTHGGLTDDSLRVIGIYGALGDSIYTEAGAKPVSPSRANLETES